MQATKPGIDFRNDYIVGSTRICECGVDYIVTSRTQIGCKACGKKRQKLKAKLYRESKK